MSGGAGGTSMSMIENSVGLGVGNYKGVMLCNRPFGGTSVATGKQPGSEKTQFTCGVVPDAPGLSAPIANRDKFLKRPKKDSVLTKHKKWLSDLQKTKERLEVQYLEEMRQKEESLAKFQDHEKKMREMTLGILKPDDKSQSKEENPATNSPEQKDYYNNDSKADSKPLKNNNYNNNNNKPAWAMTKEAADDVKTSKEIEEEEDLINFAKSLDFDRYIDDIEVQTMVEKLRRRIVELEKEVVRDDQREADAEERKNRREMLELMGLTESSLKGEKDFSTGNEEAMAALAAARQLLQEDEDMQGVHSTKSVSVLLKAAKEKINNVAKSNSKETGEPIEFKVTNEPTIVTYDPSEGTRLEQKNAIRNLPYMHRNPAV